MIRCTPLLSPRTTQAQPNPLTIVRPSNGSCATHQARAASMLARSALANDEVMGLVTAADTVGGRVRPRRRTTVHAPRARPR